MANSLATQRFAGLIYLQQGVAFVWDLGEASLMIDADVHQRAITEILGHTSIRTTVDIYGHLMKGLQEAVVAVDERLTEAD